MTLTDRLPPTPDPDDLVVAFADWAFEEQGISLYPAQEEALLELVTGANVILSTPTGSGKSLVAVSAHAYEAARSKARSAGADACLTKPCLPPQLVMMVRAMLSWRDAGLPVLESRPLPFPNPMTKISQQKLEM